MPGFQAILLAMLWHAHPLASRTAGPPSPIRYDLSVRIDPAAGRMAVAGTIRLAAAGDSLRLLLWSGMQEVRFELLEPRMAATVSTDSADGDRAWFLHFAAPLPPGVEAVVRFSYRADSAAAPQFRVAGAGAFAGSGGELWYPRPGFDSLAVGTLRFEVPPGQTVIATGEPGAEPAEVDAGRWVFQVRRPALFAFASGRYHRFRQPGRYPVTLYLLAPRPDARELALEAGRAYEALSDLFGALPVKEYGVVEVEFGGSVAGTSEGSFFLADRRKLDEGFTLPFFGHEIAHAWWGNLVRSQPGSVGRMMLSEGMAQYGMLEVLDRLEGPAAAARFRRGDYPGYVLGGSTGEYFRLAAAGLEVPLTGFEPKGAQVLAVHRMANTRGYLLLGMLADRVGRPRFHAILREFVRSHQARPATWSELEAAVSRSAGMPLQRFFAAWFARPGAPTYDLVVHALGRTVRGEVRLSDTTYPAVLDIELRGGGRRMMRTIEVRRSVTRFAWRVPFPADTAVLDPASRVLRWTPERRATAEALAGFTRADWSRRFGDPSRAAAQYQAALDSLRPGDLSGAEFLVRLGLARILLSRNSPAAAREQLEQALRLPVRPPEQLPLLYLELARCAKALQDSTGLDWAITAVAQAERLAGVHTSAGPQARALLPARP